MKIIKTVTGRVKRFVKGNGGTFPKLFVWFYASIFIGCGLVTVLGVLYEFFTKGTINYRAVNEFVKEYFAPSIAGKFAVLGVLLIDKDNDGVPDEWQKDKQKEGEQHGSQDVPVKRHDT